MIEKILNYIYDKSPTQRKKLPKVLSENPEISKELDLFLSNYSIFMDKSNISYKDICDAYELLNIQMTYSRLHFLETGDYPAHEYRDEIFSNIYNNENTMSNYMLGVALSQFLWKHHFMIYQFYKKTVNKLRDKKNFLEIGPGHGLFLLELIKSIKHKEATFDCIDLSKISLNISKELIGAIKPEILPQIRFIQGDINLFNENITYDFITMGEVLEHVDNPLKILRNINRILDKDGSFFMSTCVDCPAIDHIYHFKNISEIEELISKAGFKIKDKIIAYSEEMGTQMQKTYKPDISYASILMKK